MDETYKVPSARGQVSTFRMVGRGTPPRTLFALWNGVTGNFGTYVNVRSLQVSADITAAAATLGMLRAYRVTVAPLNGTVLSKATADKRQTLGGIEARGDASADGTNTTLALTSAGGSLLWSALLPRLVTAAGWVAKTPPYEVIPREDTVITLYGNEGLVLRVEGVDAAAHTYVVNCIWDEIVPGSQGAT